MRRSLLGVFIFCFAAACFAQVKPSEPTSPVKNTKQLDTANFKKKGDRKFNPEALNKNKKTKPLVSDYKIIAHSQDTTFLDTTLTIQKEYKFNYLRKDNFELLSFNNIGQTYNKLAYNFNENQLLPAMGFRAKHYNYKEVEDINYYYVPTPLTDMFFKTAFEQGQLVDTKVAVNTSKQFNFSIGYKGLRSLGKYQNILTSTGNFVFSSNYKSLNDRYKLRFHIATQDVLQEENGGLTKSEEQFTSGNPEFLDRSLVEVQFEDAEGTLKGKRYFADQNYSLLQARDSLRYYDFKIGHQFNYETKSYRFEKTAAGTFFGDTYAPGSIRDDAKLIAMSNQLYLSYHSKLTGTLRFKTTNYSYNYLQGGIVYLDDVTIPNSLTGETVTSGLDWKHKLGAFNIMLDANVVVSGDLEGESYSAQSSFDFNDDFSVSVGILSKSQSPNFNFLMYQSKYQQYNWYNEFKNQETQALWVTLKSNKWLTLTANYSSISNYTYFAEEEGVDPSVAFAQVLPMQYDQTIDYLKVKLENEFRFGNFGLHNTVMYQQVTQDEQVLNVPEVVTRNTLYYSNRVFKKAMYLQTGFIFNYFTAYNADGYSPLLSEFYTQNNTEIGNFPRIDFFINAKIRQTRIFLKAEHLNSSFTGYNYYSAPNYPYRDFSVRFGLVWNFFS
jgi:hypothetical protein